MTDLKLPASVQFHDNLEEISSLIERRFSKKKIWEMLKEKNKYSGDYTHFLRLVKKEFDDKSSVQVSRKKPKKIEPKKNQITISSSDNQKQQQTETVEEDEEGPLMFMNDLGINSKT